MTWSGEDVWSTVKSTAQVSSSGLLSERRKTPKTPETPIRQFGQKGDGETEGEGNTDRQANRQQDSSYQFCRTQVFHMLLKGIP